MSGSRTTTSVTLSGTPVELGMQIAQRLLTQPIQFAAAQLADQELEEFCCSLLSTVGALIARQIGRDRAALITQALADVAAAEAEADAHGKRETLQ